MVGIITAYYSTEDLQEARDLLYFLVDPNGHLPRLPKKCNMACGIVFHLNDQHGHMPWIFLALDLNRIPFIDLNDEDNLKMFEEQQDVNVQLEQVLAEQLHVKEQLALISDQLKRINEKRQHSDQTISTRAESQPNRPRDVQRPTPKAHDSTRTVADVVQQQVPRGYTADADGFMTKVKHSRQQQSGRTPAGQRRSQRPMVTGVRKRGILKPTVNTIRIFATRLHPDESEADLKAYVTDLIGDDCKIERIQVRTDRHSSFIVTASRCYEQILLDPKSWEEGVQVRYFYGRLGTSNQHGST